ncbi:flavin reductase family protein [Amycolatopsis anabasis]|uniref:flavin reductase family protein n=1 Tax=Amycolatopsis anabasis TaxID=1840409 RepID=UPI00131BC9F1|nr:flavin reductase family protein [Amycolatopsis anabasis]
MTVAGFTEAMASLAGGVCVVTCVDEAGTPRGFAATSVTSVSLDPPLVLVCLAKTSRSHPVFSRCEWLAVNVLTAEQQELAVRFSTPVADRFAGAGFGPGRGGAPVHPDALANVECRRIETVDAGDHSVLLAEVAAVRTRTGEPLVYHGRQYQRLVPAN